MKDPIMTIEHINKNFGGVVAASDVSFEVLPGRIQGLIGPNGAGKTTLLNIISGIYIADSGTILFDGKDITKMPAHKRAHLGIARTFQQPRFLTRESIRNNLMLGTDLAEHSKYLKSFFSKSSTHFLPELEYYMSKVGFEIDLDKDISSLTYGQMKVLEIVRALLTHPKVMLVDEPAAGLISSEEEDVLRLLDVATKELGIAVILIEHSMDLIMRVCEHIVVLNFGKLIAAGTPSEISSDPAVIEAYLGGENDA